MELVALAVCLERLMALAKTNWILPSAPQAIRKRRGKQRLRQREKSWISQVRGLV